MNYLMYTLNQARRLGIQVEFISKFSVITEYLYRVKRGVKLVCKTACLDAAKQKLMCILAPVSCLA